MIQITSLSLQFRGCTETHDDESGAGAGATVGWSQLN